jgi:hypothetical protein
VFVSLDCFHYYNAIRLGFCCSFVNLLTLIYKTPWGRLQLLQRPCKSVTQHSEFLQTQSPGVILIVQMSESKKTVLNGVHKLSEKMEDYNKHLTLLRSDISKIQSLMDHSMRSIQALRKEQVLLLKSVGSSSSSSGVHGGVHGSMTTSGVMGPSLAPAIPEPAPPHPLPQHFHEGDMGNCHNYASFATPGLHDRVADSEHKHHCMPKIDFL